MLRIAVLISGTGTNMIAIHKACLSGKINGEVVAVGSDNPKAEGLTYARKNFILDFFIDYRKPKKIRKENKDWEFDKFLPDDFNLEETLHKQHLFSWGDLSVMHRASDAKRFFQNRAIIEADLLDKLKPYNIDLLVLAGFMRIFTPYIIDKINLGGIHRIMNIHPALLPAFPGTDGYGDTFNYGCKVGGCTVHFVDYGEDTGPIIGQRTYVINPEDTLDDIKKKGLANEWELYPECIQLFAEGRLKVVKNVTGRKIVKILPKK